MTLHLSLFHTVWQSRKYRKSNYLMRLFFLIRIFNAVISG
ncbi:hypothetical protein HMPREF0105_0866 [Bacteroides sp. 3_1_33FAA]|uniref:Uncharacterized protein n=1 Tax=Phocaeicola dorei DSM 17855 TaxID=483217 RepID=B6W1I0_9BACT|nr:hypothetical protein BACDOR_03530 [Phocaeicola dorei DSM 17855]EEZ23483.1 hypothetical protein HMPREF0105_0866 [Bacteroides sp. 3_1_33FAA]